MDYAEWVLEGPGVLWHGSLSFRELPWPLIGYLAYPRSLAGYVDEEMEELKLCRTGLSGLGSIFLEVLDADLASGEVIDFYQVYRPGSNKNYYTVFIASPFTKVKVPRCPQVTSG